MIFRLAFLPLKIKMLILFSAKLTQKVNPHQKLAWTTYQVHVLETIQQLAVTVLQSMGLINNDTTPFNLTKLRTV